MREADRGLGAKGHVLVDTYNVEMHEGLQGFTPIDELKDVEAFTQFEGLESLIGSSTIYLSSPSPWGGGGKENLVPYFSLPSASDSTGSEETRPIRGQGWSGTAVRVSHLSARSMPGASITAK
jgi:hypothetical protein